MPGTISTSPVCTTSLTGTRSRTPLAQHLLALASTARHPNQDASDPPPTLMEQPDAVPSIANLPIALTRFIGREADVQAGLGLLEHTRLLVLVGAGGMGKTRLAYTLVTRAVTPGEQLLIAELAHLSDPAHLAEAIAELLALPHAPDRTTKHV